MRPNQATLCVLLAVALQSFSDERGGIAHTFHVLVAKLAKVEAKPELVWIAVGGPFKDHAAFLDALRSGKLDDRLDYGH